MGHPTIPCPCGQTAHPQPLSISPYSAWPIPSAFPPAPPRCPATTRHQRRYGVEVTGLQCHYEPGHDGDHAAYAGPGAGDIFWPQEASSGQRMTDEIDADPDEAARLRWDEEGSGGGSGSGGASWSPPPGTKVTVT